jgi:hypothetical protein
MSIDLTDPAWDAEAIMPSDTINLVTPARMVYVGGAGAVAAVMRSGAVVTFAAVPVGTVLPIQVARINATSTTATNLVALR